MAYNPFRTFQQYLQGRSTPVATGFSSVQSAMQQAGTGRYAAPVSSLPGLAGPPSPGGIPMSGFVTPGPLQGPPAPITGAPMSAAAPAQRFLPATITREGVRVGEGVVQAAGRPQRFLPATIAGRAPSSALSTITKEGVRVGEGVLQAASRPAAGGAMELYTGGAAAGQAAASNARTGMWGQLRNAVTGRGAGGTLRKLPTRGGGIAGIGGAVAGNMLDESSWLGGDESVANDTASKMLKWGGAGAALGSMVPGVGTVVGGLGGAAVGAGHEFLERQGILGGPSRDERIADIVSQAQQGSLGVPQSARDELQRQYEVTLAFAETPEDEELAAQQYAEQLETVAMQAAMDPTAFMSEQEMMDAAPLGTRIEASPEQAAMAQTMFMQDLLARTVQPYAEDYQNQANAAADAILATAPGGQAGALLRSQAEQFRANGSRDAMNITQYALSLPAVNALQNQASMLNQLASQQQQQAMSAVTSGAWQQFLAQQQAGAAGGGDLNSILENLG